MAIDPRIALGVQPPPFNNPFDQLMQMRDQQQRRQLIDQQIRSGQAAEESRRQDTEKQRRAEAAQAKFFDIIKRSKNDDDAEALIRAEVPEFHAPYLEQRQKAEKAASELQETTLKRKKLDEEIAVKGQEYAAPYLQMVEKSGYDPAVMNFALNSIEGHGFPVEPLRQQAAGGPEAIKRIIDGFKSTQQQNADTTAAAGAAQLPGQRAQSTIAQAQAANLSPTGLTPDQQRQATQATATATEAARHNRAQEGFEAQRVAQTASDRTDLTPEGLDAAAMLFAKTGTLPALGMGDKTTRKAIINRAAAMTPGLDVASAKADYAANKASLGTLQKSRDAISAFEKTAEKNIDIFLETAGKVVDTGSPLANTYVRAVTGKILGSPDQARFDAARQVAINEIAKITAGGASLGGVLSDSARKEVEAFNPSNATLKQTVGVMRLLKQDMANRASSMDDTIAGIQGRLNKATDTPSAGVVKKYNPATGKVE